MTMLYDEKQICHFYMVTINNIIKSTVAIENHTLLREITNTCDVHELEQKAIFLSFPYCTAIKIADKMHGFRTNSIQQN